MAHNSLANPNPIHQPKQHVAARFARGVAAGALALVALSAPAPAHAGESSDNSIPSWWTWLQAHAEPTRLVEPIWGTGSIELSHSSGRLQATYAANISVGVKGEVEIALLGAGGAVREVKYAGADADWLVRGGVVIVRLGAEAARNGAIHISAQWPLDPATGQAIAVPVPAWPHGKVNISGSEFEVFGQDTDNNIGGNVRALLVRGSASSAPRIRAARYKVTLRPGVADIELRVEVEARGAEANITLAPKELALVDVLVDGKPVAAVADEENHAVALTGRGLRVITARLQVPTDGDDTDQGIEIGRVASPITEVEVRVAGKKSVRFEPEVPLQTSFSNGQTVVRSYLPPGDTLKVGFSVEGDAVERTVRFAAETWQVLTLDEGLLRGKATFQLSIVQGKATAIQIALPDDVVIANVDGPQVATWDVLAAAGALPRRVRVGLTDPGGEAAGPATRKITLTFERPSPREAGAALEVPLVRPIGAFRESGAVVLLDGEKVGFAALEGAQGWVRAGLEALPPEIRTELDGRADQVWRHIGAPPKLATKISAARVREVRLEARGTALVRIDERALHASHVVVVEVKAGRTDKLILDLPDTVGEPHVVAPSLSRVAPGEGIVADKGRKFWELRFSTALEGSVQLQIDLEQLIAADVTKLSLPEVRIRGAEVEVGVLALSAEAGLELIPSAKGETRPVPTTELPEALARQAGSDLVAGFRSPRGAIQLEIALQRRATVATLDAFARQVWLESNVLSDGRVASRAVLVVASAGRPVIRVALPKDAEVLALTVNGAHVKAVKDEKGWLAVPLGGGASVRVEIRYEQKSTGLDTLGHLTLTAPLFDVRQGPLAWRLRLPGDRHVYRVDTELRAADGGAASQPPTVEKDDLVPLPMPYEVYQLHFGTEVRDAKAAATINLLLGSALPISGSWFWLVVAGGLAVLVWRRKGRGKAKAAAAAAASAASADDLTANEDETAP